MSNNGEELELGHVAHPEVGYDRTDLSARGIFMFLIGLSISIIIILLISVGLLRYFTANRLVSVPRTAAIVTPTRLTQGEPTQRFPAPQLQPDPVADLNKFRAAVEQQLNSYGWTDQKAGIVHIPIERAIDLMSQQGLPTRQPPALPPRATFGSGDSSTPLGAGAGTEPKSNQ